MKTWLLVGPLAILVWCAPGVVAAQSTDLDAQLRRGVELRLQGHDDAALAVFRQAWEASHAPRAQAQMAMAEQSLGHWIEAEQHLQGALATSDPWVASHRDSFQQTLLVIAGHLGRLEVRGGQAGAEVRIDGRRVAALPMEQPVRVLAGSVSFEVVQPGFATVRRTVTVSPGGLAREAVVLVPVLPEAPVVVAPRTTAPVPAPRLPESPGRGRTQRALGWSALAVGGLLVLGGGVSLGVRAGAVARWNDDSRCLAGAGTRQEQCPDDARTISTSETVAVVGFVAGGVLAATSVLLLALAPTPPRETTVAGFTCGQGPGTLGVACGGTF